MHKNTIRIKNGERIRSLVALLSFVIIFGVAGVLLEVFSHADSITTVDVSSGYSGYCMDNYEDTSTAGTKVDLYTCNASTAQKWSIDNTTETMKGNGLCVGLYDNGTATNTDVVMATCTGSTTQQWLQESNGNLVNIGSEKKCLDAAKEENGTQLTIVTCTTTVTNAQTWKGGPVIPTVAPTISSVAANNITTSAATITWTTSEASTGQVKYGATTAYGTTSAEVTTLATSHSVTLSGLSSATTYHVEVVSLNAQSQAATSSDYVLKTATAPVATPAPTPTPVTTVTSTSTPEPIATLGITTNGSDTGSGSTDTGSGSSTGSGSAAMGSGSNTVSATTQSTGSTSTNSSVPTITNLTASHIETHSVILSWKVAKPAKYIIKYGSAANKLTETVAYTSTKTSISITLSNLKSGKPTYISITPEINNKLGTTKLVSFNTPSSGSNLMGTVLAIVLSLVIVGLIALFIARTKSKSPKPYAPQPSNPLPEAPQIVPQQTYARPTNQSSDILDANVPANQPPIGTLNEQEDQSSYNARVNWWLPKYIQQQGTAAIHKKKSDGVPDMFEQGRERLNDLEEHHRIPKT
jgi:hypothetical protein